MLQSVVVTYCMLGAPVDHVICSRRASLQVVLLSSVVCTRTRAVYVRPRCTFALAEA